MFLLVAIYPHNSIQYNTDLILLPKKNLWAQNTSYDVKNQFSKMS